MTVANGELPGTTFRTTVDLRNTSTAPAECHFEYRSARRPTEPLISRVAVPPGQPTVMDEFARELSVATTIRVRCTADVEIYSRLHTSTDGGATYSEGRLFSAVASTPIAAGGEKSVVTSADLIIAETSGRPASVTVRLARADGGTTAKRYNLHPFGQRILDLSEALPSPRSLTLVVQNEGAGSIVILRETRDPKLADRAVRLTAEQRQRFEAHVAAAEAPPSRTPSVAAQLLLSPFKAAPFRDPFTGLDFMRDRVYDPSTGSFLTPDPEGYSDSSNAYAYCGGDPVNCSDPTGRTGEQDLKADILLKREREAAGRRSRAMTAQHRLILRRAAATQVRSNVREWSTIDAARYKAGGGGSYIFPFKQQWINGYSNVIRAAALEYDIPASLLAMVAFNEVGGAPGWTDPVLYSARCFLPSCTPRIGRIVKPRQETSFGNVSTQIRRAAQTLGYSRTGLDLDLYQESLLIESLQDPRTNIFIAAKHLAELRDVDFRGKSTAQLTSEDLVVIATRYNRGMELPLSEIQRDLTYGQDALRHLPEVERALVMQ